MVVFNARFANELQKAETKNGAEMAMTTPTVELDQDVANLLAEECRNQGKTLVEVANAKLRESMQGEKKHSGQRGRIQIKTFSSEYAPGVDPTRLNQLYDQMEIDDYIRKAEKRKTEL